MNSIIGTVVGILALSGAGVLTKTFYYHLQRETVTKVHHGLSPLEGFTHRLTKQKSKF